MKLTTLVEGMEKDTFTKTQQREQDKEMYQNIINTFSAQISEMIHKEVENRHSADLENKLYSQNLTSQFHNDIEQIRIDINETIIQTQKEVQNLSKECSERAHNLSKYTDQQIEEAIHGKNSSVEMLKNFVHKLTQQMKHNVELQNKQNENLHAKIANIELALKATKKELKENINTTELRLINKLHDVKVYSELNIKKEHEKMTEAVTKLGNNTDFYLENLKEQLINTRNVMGYTLSQMEASNKKQLTCIVNDIEKVWERVYNYEDLLKQYDEQNKAMKAEFEFNMQMFNNRFDIWCEPDPSGMTNGIQFWGHSFIAGPQGEFLAHFGETEQCEVIEVSMERSETVRQWWPFLRDRRIEEFGALAKRYLDEE